MIRAGLRCWGLSVSPSCPSGRIIRAIHSIRVICVSGA